MASNNKKALFWTSYSDLMTSMFFAMLVLFIVVVVAMGAVNRQMKVVNDQLEDALKKANVTIEQQNQILRERVIQIYILRQFSYYKYLMIVLT